MADYSNDHKHKKEKAFTRLRIGANVEVLETELNTQYVLINERIRENFKTLFTSGPETDIAPINSGIDNTIILPEILAKINGWPIRVYGTNNNHAAITPDGRNYLYCGLPVDVGNRTDLVFIEIWEEVVTYLDAINTHGTQNSDYSETNDLKDPRMSDETARAMVLKNELRVALNVDPAFDRTLEQKVLSVTDKTGAAISNLGEGLYGNTNTGHYIIPLFEVDRNTSAVIGPANFAAIYSLSKLKVKNADLSENTHDHDGTDSEQIPAANIPISDPGNLITATTVEGALQENRQLTKDHIEDTTAAHAASAISIVDAGNKITATELEGAIQELATNKADGNMTLYISGEETSAGVVGTVNYTLVTPLDVVNDPAYFAVMNMDETEIINGSGVKCQVTAANNKDLTFNFAPGAQIKVIFAHRKKLSELPSDALVTRYITTAKKDADITEVVGYRYFDGTHNLATKGSLDSRVTALEDGKFDKTGGTISGDTTMGDTNDKNLFTKAVVTNINTLKPYLTYTGNDLTKVELKEGSTVVKTIDYTYTNGNVTRIVETVGGKTITTDITYDP